MAVNTDCEYARHIQKNTEYFVYYYMHFPLTIIFFFVVLNIYCNGDSIQYDDVAVEVIVVVVVVVVAVVVLRSDDALTHFNKVHLHIYIYMCVCFSHH